MTTNQSGCGRQSEKEHRTGLKNVVVWNFVTYNSSMETETLEAMLTRSDSQILLLVITLVFGFVALKLFSKLLRRLLLISSLDNAVVHFCASSVQIVLGVLLVLFALSLIDIPLTSMIALISAFGVALGLALQDSIANVANGLIMIGTRPFKVGDYVRIGSDEGTIEELRLMDTVLKTENNQKLILPNRTVFTSRILNYNTNSTRRLDLQFPLDMENDLDKVVDVTRAACQSCRTVLRTPAVRIELAALSATPELLVWCWIDSRSYNDALFEVNRAVYEAYRKAGIRIPCDQIAIAQKPTTRRKSTSTTRQPSNAATKK